MKELNLQLFAEEEAQEIPAELEGVSEEVAREVMKEAAAEQQEERQEEQPQEAQEETQETIEPQEEEAAHAEPDSDNKGKVPYERFKEVNDKYRKMEQEAQALRQQLAQMQQQPQQEVPRQTETQQETQEAQKKDQPIVPMDLLKQAYEIAKDQVISSLGLTEEEYTDLEYQDEAGKAEIDRAIKFQYDSICQQARERAQMLAQQEQMKQQALQTAYNDYLQNAEEEQKRGDFNDIWEYATTEHWSGLAPYHQAVIQNAFTSVNNGQGTLEQIQLVRDYYEAAKAAYLAQDKSAVTQNKKVANVPRVDKVRGTPSAGGMTMAEVERMINETPWEQVPKEIRDQLLSGRLR